jgi:hypothetical protein
MKRQFPDGTPAYLAVGEGADYGVTSGAFTVNAEKATVLATLRSSLQDKKGKPAAIVTAYGKGKIGVIGINIGTQYNNAVQYQHRDLIRKMTAMLYNPIARVESVDGICEIVCLSVDGKPMLQVINAGGGFGVWYTSKDPLLKKDDYKKIISTIAKEMWRCAEIGKNEAHYQTTIGDSITKRAFEQALEEFKGKGYNVSYNLESNLGVSVTISWPLDL